MKIKKFSIENYRSIVERKSIDLENMSIIVGPNNEGKSNILNAMTSALLILTSPFTSFSSRKSVYLMRRIDREYRYMGGDIRLFYRWERDFPVGKQEKDPDGKTIFEIVFDFAENELDELNKVVNLNLSNEIIFRLILGKDSIDVDIKYPSNKRIKLNNRKNKILKYLHEHIAVEYIGSSRTAESTKKLIDNLIEREIRQNLETDKKYEELIKKIEKVHEPVLKKISKEVTKSIGQFLPNIKEVEVTSTDKIRRIIHESCEVNIDDGNKTPLELKGDGIKSLVSISLLHNLAKQKHKKQNIVFAIEEPEAHLHPDSIHKLKEILNEISESYQVIITTHSPIFVDRTHLEKNILVTKNNIKTAKDISEIREEIGVRVSDNLKSATLVVLTEGRKDIEILKTWLFELSPKIKIEYNKGVIVFDSMNGCGNLSYVVSLYQNLLCNVLVFLDGDDEARKHYEKSEKHGLISQKNIFFATIRSKRETEIENLVRLKTYKDEINEKFGVELKRETFRSNKKWSSQVGEEFKNQAKKWDDDVKASVKQVVCNSVVKNGLKSLDNNKSNSILKLKEEIEKILKI